jgi:hypothetical protein
MKKQQKGNKYLPELYLALVPLNIYSPLCNKTDIATTSRVMVTKVNEFMISSEQW